jgi:flagellar motility protein MotE (MotC chaperone)
LTLRLLPIVGIAASALLGLKVLGLLLGHPTTVLPIQEAQAQAPAANQTPPPPAGQPPAGQPPAAAAPADPAAPPADPAASAAPPPADGAAPPADPAAAAAPPMSAPSDMEIGGSAAERAVLESLGQRRRALSDQEGQLDLREKLLQATEDRVQQRVDELKALEQKIEQAVDEKRKQEESEVAGLVVMYENMKPKDAARIFDRLELEILLKVVRQMKPRKMADILAKMNPEAAEKLTVAIASGDTEKTANTSAPAQLPKIGSN